MMSTVSLCFYQTLFPCLLNFFKIFSQSVVGTALTTSTSKRDSIPTLSYDDTMIECLEQYLSFLAEHFDALFPQQYGASLPNATGNVFFPTVIDAYICRTAVDLLSLYHTDGKPSQGHQPCYHNILL